MTMLSRPDGVRDGAHNGDGLTAIKTVALAMVVAVALCSQARALELKIARTAGAANGEVLVLPDCANSNLRIAPCQRAARSWVNYLNSKAQIFVQAYRAAGHNDDVSEVVLDCSAGIYNNRKTRKGIRNSRHAYGEACDGKSVRVNSVTFSYRRAVTDAASPDRRFFVSFLDGWGVAGPGCVPEKGYVAFGYEIGCRPVLTDNCGVIDWRERGAKSQYGHTYHLSYCYYTDPARAYE